MRVICFFQGGCKYETIYEEWIQPKDKDDFKSLLRFEECIYCHEVKSTITHPHDHKSRWSIATKVNHRTIVGDVP
jgi:hypothetical protein